MLTRLYLLRYGETDWNQKFFFEKIIERHQGNKILVVTHGGVIKL
ncbi:Histidine phosphatase superfamily (branch 1) [Halanaerobium congolense]|nr:histidine phosphatase family protein [Halanaerobium congolense]SHM82691.1 Histidine phosphatase superfamily (branch 1) [Halanaerobium congolense]